HVLAPKVKGVVNLDQATKELALDFFVLFSSVSGAVGNVGQADYATANAFMDAFSKYRNTLRDAKKRRGQTLSLDWSHWREGGMGIDEATKKKMQENMGLVAMETSSGFEAFYRGLASKESQVMVMAGDLRKLYAFFSKETTDGTENLGEEIDEEVFEEKIGKEALEEKTAAFLKRRLSKVLKLPAHRILTREPLEKYGIDSIMVTQLTNELEKTFGSLSKTLFFEYPNIREISRYFLESHRPRLVKLLGVHETKTIALKTKEPTGKVLLSKEPSKRSLRNRFGPILTKPSLPSETASLDIAIIGLSGRYPGARNLEEFWQNLSAGKDCIVEVPKERWDWREYYT
ncbi:MAG: KR domain-containing protein, partial [bacterium]|nr:KR domain-containing protein [bacterium]